MKKVILILSVVALVLTMGLGAFACSNVNQINFISVVARDYEHYTYTVYAKGEGDQLAAIGTFTYTFKRLQATEGEIAYYIDGHEYTLSSGGVIKTSLSISDGQYAGETVTAEVLFQNAYSPIASRKVYNAFKNGTADAERSYTSVIDYTNKKNIVATVNGEEHSFKKPSYCYDNDTLYSLARGSDISRDSYALSIAGVDNLKPGTRTVSMAKRVDTVSLDVACMSAEPIATTCIALTAAAQYGTGTSAYIYFAPSYRHTDGAGNSVDLNKVPVRIDEGNYVYKLTAISTDE